MVEILRISEVPEAPFGTVMVPITELEFPITVTIVAPLGEVMLNRHEEKRAELRKQLTLFPPKGMGVREIVRTTLV